MQNCKIVLLAVFLSITLAACASNYKKAEQDVKKPVNCATAEADIRVLESEKAHAVSQMAAGVSAIVPAGLVVGVATGTEATNVKVATGDYNQMIDQKISEIKRECGLK